MAQLRHQKLLCQCHGSGKYLHRDNHNFLILHKLPQRVNTNNAKTAYFKFSKACLSLQTTRCTGMKFCNPGGSAFQCTIMVFSDSISNVNLLFCTICNIFYRLLEWFPPFLSLCLSLGRGPRGVGISCLLASTLSGIWKCYEERRRCPTTPTLFARIYWHSMLSVQRSICRFQQTIATFKH